MREQAYRFSDVIVTIGNEEIFGYAKADDCVKITPNQDQTTDIVGADGYLIWNVSENDTATVELKLAVTSESNDTLNQIYRSYRKHGIVFRDGILIRDLSTDFEFSADNFVVKNLPEIIRGETVDSQLWTLSTGKSEMDF